MSTSPSTTEHSSSSPIKVSLWLVPPEPAYSSLKQQIHFFAHGHPPSVPFEPHITVVGGIPCRSKDHAKDMLEVLRADSLHTIGAVPVEFNGVKCDSRDENGLPVWSQAAVLVMSDTPERLKELGREAFRVLGLEGEWGLAPPLRLPHLSVYYGTENIPSKTQVKLVDRFDASQLSLWITHPASAEGVKDWEQVGTIQLDE